MSDIFSSGDTDDETVVETSLQIVNQQHNFNKRACRSNLNTSQQQVDLKSHNPYIFYSVENIFKFTVKKKPTNPKMRTIGTYKLKHRKDILIEHKHLLAPSLYELQLCFKSVNKIPLPNQLLDVRGYLEFPKNSSRSIFVVQLCTVKHGDVSEFVKFMNELKLFTPNEFTCVSDNADQVDDASLFEPEDYSNYFTEIDESLLCRKLCEIELNLKENDKNCV